MALAAAEVLIAAEAEEAKEVAEALEVAEAEDSEAVIVAGKVSLVLLHCISRFR